MENTYETKKSLDVRKLNKLYAIYDKKKTQFLPLMAKANNACAIRDFTLMVNSDQSLMKKYPEDFRLHLIGYFDEENGELIDNEKTIICEATEVLNND